MKNKILWLALLLFTSIAFAQQQNATFTLTPEQFNPDDQVTITVSNIDLSQWGVSDLYLWTWFYDLNDENSQDSPTNGSWGNSDEAQKFTDNGNGTYSFTFIPQDLYGTSNIGSIGMLAKAKDGSGDKKTQDHYVEVGVFQFNLNNPTNQVTILDSGNTLTIEASTTVNANFELLANGNSVDIQNNIQNYTYNYTLNQDTNFELIATETASSNSLSATFQGIVTPNPTQMAVPAGMEDGINFDPNNPNTATLVLYAPNKDFVHVIGNFNNWNINSDYLMNYDAAQEKYWITLNNLDQTGDDVLFQYLIDGEINVADPYSTLILSPYDDPFISPDTFDNIPAYPTGMTTEAISWIRRNAPSYTWENTGFTPPAKEDLVIYEILIRDFDDVQNFDAVKNRLDYLEGLGVNAIELMPVSEFDGNLSWGYNPAFHMALDKYYGSPEMLKEFIDECHARDIAVILDVVYNHATGQNPLYRMYNDCNGCTGGIVAADSPYFNVSATHTYSVFNDFNHQSIATQNYVNKTLEYWIEEFHIDGYRWDLTKGFTQNCSGNETCTNSYQADRVQVLKDYADTQWAADSDFYIVFEHLGSGSSRNEEIEWANYRLDEGKGIMFWNKLNYNYNEATMGWNANSNFSDISYENIGIPTPRNVGYMESHDEERLMFKNLAYGNSSGSYDVTNLSTALDRMETAGAFFFTVPGPKMIWQFGELGYDTSIFACSDGTIPNDDSCKLSEKPDGWDFLNETDRTDLYDAYAQMIALKKGNEIFATGSIEMNVDNSNGLKSIHLENPNATGNEIKYVTIIGNFGVTTQSIDPAFQETGTWYNLMNNNTYQVSDVNATIALAPGEYFIYGNEEANLNNEVFKTSTISLYPNPTSENIYLSEQVDSIKIYDLTGKQILVKENIRPNQAINVSSFTKGIYLLQLEQNGDRIQKKLIVN
ncbi:MULTISPECIES: alpha-amylase family glycosyl hydrolase [Mesonia]|uniref:Malto-oligosyltrehalose trehalohydrolase n=1 Tax=Mesonia oceanica TaxID=2687242 RepID=A0AC61YA55_9FLAO|nr:MULTISPECIES: alpha-amylase family glycosyl hydrolase [Mesonia]MAN25863.1 alpha-amlyase [Mesonia sp.]MAN27517.1 alpha-amlyase [Mesonia sp.]MAQ40599.1 alpha-amlyase [Mesonia sp.]VVV01018.1 Malto-oligosyltrehalose trehalohydrolase [Mesonia oceanica]|tara:strand:+ start:21841 stop:24648 length:2808 start_codon:yes stop_codon:yes gene_type:complete